MDDELRFYLLASAFAIVAALAAVGVITFVCRGPL